MFFDKEDLHKKRRFEALGQFAGGIAHDFNNILSIIDACAGRALNPKTSPEDVRQQLQKIRDAAQRGAALTRQMLSFASQKVEADITVEAVSALEDLKPFLKTVLGDAIRLDWMLPDTPAYINGSQDMLAQILINLALNAHDAMAGKGTFHVYLTQTRKGDIPAGMRKKYPHSKHFLTLSVIDTGAGIDKDILPRIFEPFFTTKNAAQGSGLGLAVVHGVVEQMGGMITVETQKGEGTAFEMVFPAVDSAADKVLDAGITDAADLVGKTVLLAEDEPELRHVLALMLKDMNMTVIEAANGNDAARLQETYEGNIDFLLTDVVMPEMDGLTLGEMFARERPDANIVFMSGYPFAGQMQEKSMPEDADFISKPLSEDRLRQILARALERRDARQSDSRPPDTH